MSLPGQRVQPQRYTVLPRTLTFLTRPGQVLLMRIPPGRGAWAGLYNGLGGHIEQGEDPLTSARREVSEESGISPGHLRLSGVVLVDTGSKPGIGLYVYTGEPQDGVVRSGPEGSAEWVNTAELPHLPLVEDLPILLDRILSHKSDTAPFSAVYSYDGQGRLDIHFGE
jgi:8-oxo-dGTP diphosphatase